MCANSRREGGFFYLPNKGGETLDGTTNPRDTSGVASDSSVGEEGTSKQTPETFTKETEKKAVSDALARAGRDAKTLTEERQRVEKLLADFRKERDEAELKSADGDPDAEKAIKARQALANKEAELADKERKLDEEKASIKDRLEGAEQVTKELSARDIASKYGVDAEPLIKFTDGSSEAMEELAQSLPRKASTPLKVDSGETVGGSKTYKENEILPSLDPSTMTPAEIKAKVQEIEKARIEGKIETA